MNTKSWIKSLLVIAIWSTSAFLVSKFTPGTNPFVTAGLVVITSSVIQIIFMLKTDHTFFRKIKFHMIKSLFFPGLCGLFLYPIFFFLGMSTTEPTKANITNYLWPLIAGIIYQWGNNQDVKTKDLICLATSFLGAILVLVLHNEPNILYIFNPFDYGVLWALIGAICYGIYSGIIKKHIPILDPVLKTEMTASQRMLIMTCTSAILFIISYFIMLIIGKGSEISCTCSVIFSNKDTVLFFILYAVLNFTIAHWIWNMLNYGNSATRIANTAYLIPVLSTIFLTWWGKQPLGIPSAIGLCLIVTSLVISNYRHLNSVIFTFTSIFIFILLDSLLPTTDNQNNDLFSNAQFFLETVIAMFAIYYGFVLNRVVSDVKEYEKTLYEIDYSKILLNDQFPDKLPSILKKGDEWEENLKSATQSLSCDEKYKVCETISNISNLPRSILSIAEWVVLLLLSLSIFGLCAIIRTDIVWMKLITLSVCVSICLCGSILIEQEKKYRTIKESILKNGQ